MKEEKDIFFHCPKSSKSKREELNLIEKEKKERKEIFSLLRTCKIIPSFFALRFSGFFFGKPARFTRPERNCKMGSNIYTI